MSDSILSTSKFILFPVTVKVEDRNDCEPQFLEQYYNVSLQENEWPPQRLATVQAVDRDSGNNGRISLLYNIPQSTCLTYLLYLIGHACTFTGHFRKSELRTIKPSSFVGY